MPSQPRADQENRERGAEGEGLPELNARIEEVEEIVTALHGDLSQTQRELAENQAILSELQATAAHAEEDRFVSGPGRDDPIHETASSRRGAPNWLWTTKCGWRYGYSRYIQWSLADATSARRGKCLKCFKHSGAADAP